MTESVADILANNINSICKSKKIDFSVTKEYLLEDVKTQSKIIANEYINYIQKLNKDEIIKIDSILMDIELFLKNYSVEEKKSELYMEIGLKFRESNLYEVASKYFLKAYESSCSAEVTNNALIRLGSCNIYLSKYKEALNYFDILSNLANSTENKFIANFNIALCYKKLNQYEESLEVLNIITKEYMHILDNSIERNLNVNLLKGVCLNELNYFNKSITVYKILLESLNEHIKYKVLVMCNLADVYSKTKDIAKLNKICSQILNIINKNPNVLDEYDFDIRLSLFKNLKISNFQNEKVLIDLLMVALESFKNGTSYACIDDIEKALINLLDIFIINDNSEKIYKLKNDIFEMIENNKFPKCNIVILKIINYYNWSGKREEISNIINYITAC